MEGEGLSAARSTDPQPARPPPQSLPSPSGSLLLGSSGAGISAMGDVRTTRLGRGNPGASASSPSALIIFYSLDWTGFESQIQQETEYLFGLDGAGLLSIKNSPPH